jgi:hypothetical protein
MEIWGIPQVYLSPQMGLKWFKINVSISSKEIIQ